MKIVYNFLNIAEMICFIIVLIKYINMEVRSLSLMVRKSQLPKNFSHMKKSKTEDKEVIYIPYDKENKEIDILEEGNEEVAEYAEYFYKQKDREKGFRKTFLVLALLILIVEFVFR